MSRVPRILVIDDEASNVALLERLLRREGYRDVVSTTDPLGVPDLYRRSKPDLVLLDLHMPLVDGFELLEELHSHARDAYVPIVALTADLTPEARTRALGLGARDSVGLGAGRR